MNVVIGTTGWDAAKARVREIVDARASASSRRRTSRRVRFSSARLRRTAARLLAPHADYGAYLHELHHSTKRDAPSGTALSLKAAMAAAGYDRPIDVAATRAGSIPGTHTVGFDGPSETITLTHAVRDRGTFARGALVAAQWVEGAMAGTRCTTCWGSRVRRVHHDHRCTCGDAGDSQASGFSRKILPR